MTKKNLVLLLFTLGLAVVYATGICTRTSSTEMLCRA